MKLTILTTIFVMMSFVAYPHTSDDELLNNWEIGHVYNLAKCNDVYIGNISHAIDTSGEVVSFVTLASQDVADVAKGNTYWHFRSISVFGNYNWTPTLSIGYMTKQFKIMPHNRYINHLVSSLCHLVVEKVVIAETKDGKQMLLLE